MEDAILEAQLAVQYTPADDPEMVRKMNTRLGNYAFQVNRYELAEEAFLRVLEVEDGQYNANYKLGRIYREWGRFAEALSYAEKALEVASEDKVAEAQQLVDELRQESGGQ
jgi:tetratricopeptide (TPR) repeat protein